MPYGLYISASGADVQAQRLEVLSHNLANLDTPGFKRDFAVLQARHSEAIERGDDIQGSGSINNIGGGVKVYETVTDFSPGLLKRTGRFTDLAIDDDGSGFFVLEKDGQQLLTRAGNFHFSAEGELQTQSGHRVLSEDDRPITINPSGPPPRLLPDGAIAQGDVTIRLKLVKPQSFGDLAKVGGNQFSPLAETIPLAANERHVVSEHLEMSTVKPAQAMMELITASRAYEANIKIIQHQDQMIGTLLNRVLRQS